MFRPPKPKRSNKPCDRLGYKKDGLTWKWKWPNWCFDEYQNCWHGGKGYQVANAFKNTKFNRVNLHSVRWEGQNNNPYYETYLELDGGKVLSTKEYPTRIKAQLAGEQLFKEFVKALSEL